MNIPRPDGDKGWTAANFVYFSYALFLAGFYFVPNAVDLYKYYIFAVFLPGLLLLPEAIRVNGGSRILLLITAYLLYMLVSSGWSEDFSGAMLWRDVRYVAYILMFLSLTALFLRRGPCLLPAILQTLTFVAAIAALVSLAGFDGIAQLPALPDTRLHGVGITENPNTSAFVYGPFAVAALYYIRVNRGRPLLPAYAACFFAITAFVVLTQSNTGLLALTCACATLLLAGGRASPRGLALGMVLGLFAVVFLSWSLGLLNAQADIGFTRRLPIWEYVLGQWHNAPLFGNGLQKAIVLDADGGESAVNYAHSIFLSTLRDGGLVGLALLLPVYLLALRQGIYTAASNGNALYLSLFCFGLVCVLVDVDQAITRPRELWIMLWLPLACLIAAEGESRGQRPDSSPKNTRT